MVFWPNSINETCQNADAVVSLGHCGRLLQFIWKKKLRLELVQLTDTPFQNKQTVIRGMHLPGSFSCKTRATGVTEVEWHLHREQASPVQAVCCTRARAYTNTHNVHTHTYCKRPSNGYTMTPLLCSFCKTSHVCSTTSAETHWKYVNTSYALICLAIIYDEHNSQLPVNPTLDYPRWNRHLRLQTRHTACDVTKLASTPQYTGIHKLALQDITIFYTSVKSIYFQYATIGIIIKQTQMLNDSHARPVFNSYKIVIM